METSQVFFADLRSSAKESLLDKIARLVKEAGLEQVVRKRDLVALKLHFG